MRADMARMASTSFCCRASPTCARSTVSGVFSWCEALATKRTCASASWRWRSVWALMASISGTTSRGTVRVSIGSRSAGSRLFTSSCSRFSGDRPRRTPKVMSPADNAIKDSCTAVERSTSRFVSWCLASSVSATCTSSSRRSAPASTMCCRLATRTRCPL